jgi:hypothetical protein
MRNETIKWIITKFQIKRMRIEIKNKTYENKNKKLKEWQLKLKTKQMINCNWMTKLKNYNLLSK